MTQINVLHNKSGSHEVPNVNSTNFTCLLVDFGKRAPAKLKCFFKRNSIPQILAVLFEILRLYI